MTQAKISACGRYRYWLTRECGVPKPRTPQVMFVMLNPSTADSTTDDPTIRRCRGFAQSWGADGLIVANLYALRSTDPKALWASHDPVGLWNDHHLKELLGAATRGHVVCAWGANAKPERVAEFIELANRSNCRLWCLGVTKSGAPRHPLYIKKGQPLVPYPTTQEHTA